MGAIGIRADGTIVASFNGGVKHTKVPCLHAEARLCRKLDVGSTVYVARVARSTGKLAMARPCERCRKRLKNKGVKVVHYTIDEEEHGTMRL